MRSGQQEASLDAWGGDVSDVEIKQLAATALRTMDVAAAVLTAAGRFVMANVLLDRHVPSRIVWKGDRIALAGAAQDRALQQAIFAVRPGDTIHIAMPATLHLGPAILWVGRPLPIGTLRTLVISDTTPAQELPSRVLQELFRLTPAEAEVARAVGDARCLKSLARTMGVSIETVRTQLKAVFAKTGTNRQAELVRLLASLNRGGSMPGAHTTSPCASIPSYSVRGCLAMVLAR